MTHRERLLTALDLGVPDQVPVTWELVGRCAHAQTGDGGWRGQCDTHRMIGSSIFNLQGVGPEVQCELPVGFAVESEDLGVEDGWMLSETRIVTPSGTLTERRRSGGIPGDPLLGKCTRYYIQSRDDYEILATYLEARARSARPRTRESSLALDYVRDDGLVNHWINDSLYALANYRDSAEFLIDLVEIPDVLVWDICWGSTSLLNPTMVREFVVPEARWVVDSLAPGKRVVFFTTGKTRAVLDDLAHCRPHGIQHLDVLGDCDLAEVKKTFGDRFCLMGNYSPVVLAHGTPAEAQREAKRCLDAAMGGGGFIITTSDEVPADAKLENMRAVVEYVGREGRYV